jgi:hypothetical protein
LRTVGIYYFGFQTVVALSMPIYTGIESVLPTLLVRLNDNPVRQIAALARAMRSIMLAAVPLAISFALAAPLVIHLLWHGKWDMATKSTQILAACVPAWLIIHSTRALLEARGLWRLRFGLLAVNGVGGIASAACGTFFGGVGSIATSVASFYVSFGICLLLALGKLGLTVRQSATIAIKPVVLNCAALLASFVLTRLLIESRPVGALDAIQLTAFLMLAGAGNLLLFRHEWVELVMGFTAKARTVPASTNEEIEAV